MKARIELNATATDGKIELDGVDIAKDVGSFTLTAKAGHFTTLEIHTLAEGSTFQGDVRLNLSPRLRAVLEQEGWRPPLDALGLTERDRVRSALDGLLHAFGYASDEVIWDEPIKRPMTEGRADG